MPKLTTLRKAISYARTGYCPWEDTCSTNEAWCCNHDTGRPFHNTSTGCVKCWFEQIKQGRGERWWLKREGTE